MARQLNIKLVVLASILAASLSAVAGADDWPTFRHDPARTGASSEALAAPLHLQWTYVGKHPQPAWPEPGKEMHRIPFDYAYQVAVANGLVYFGSSADHKVYALDMATGRERWSFFTDAPIRFAPTFYDGRLLVASDDGWLYCLSAGDGTLLWRFYGGPRDERILGNEHMISRWPLRSGVVVVDGIVYFTAGMWPAEGIYVYALDINFGKVLWKNDSSGSMYIKLPHPTAEGFSGVAPQGDIFAYEDLLFVPTGRSLPAAFDRNTGKFLYYRPSENLRDGGSWACAADGMFFGGRHGGGPDIDVRLGEAPPAKSDGLRSWDCRTGDKRLDLVGKHRLAFAAERIFASGSGNVTAYNRADLVARKARADCVEWETPHPRAYSLIAAGDTAIVGGAGTVTAMSGADGTILWQSSVDGQARGLAVADGRLLVSTSTGQIACFGAQEVANPPVLRQPVGALPETPLSMELADKILGDTGVKAGYCLMLGAGDGQLAGQLAKRSDLNIYCIEPDVDKVTAARKTLDAAGLYGTSVTVQQASLAKLPYPEYFANLIVVNPEFDGLRDEQAARQLLRTLRPCGGKAFLAGGADKWGRAVAGLTGLADALNLTVETSADKVMVTRGALPGAGEWTHEYGDAGKSGCSTDQIAKWPLKLLWFGGPGPARMISRHWRPAAPVSTNGRMFVAGQHTVIAVDAYNGRELWCRDLRSVGRRAVYLGGGNIVADDDSVYAATGSVCFRLDAQTGETRQVYRLPTVVPRFALDQAQTLELRVDDDHSGTVTLQATAQGLVAKLVTVDDNVTNLHREDGPAPGESWEKFIENLVAQNEKVLTPALGDSWELFFDLRPAPQRGVLYGPGAFQVVVVPATTEEAFASYKAAAGPAHPELTVTGTLTPRGSETTVTLPWAEISKLAGGVLAPTLGEGGRPADFAFGVTLNSSDDGDKLATRTYKFANADSYRLTNGWATFVLDPENAAQVQAQQTAPLAAELVESHVWGFPVVTDDLVLGSAALVPPAHYVKYWSSVGTPTESDYIFALGKNDGQFRWIYAAEESISHNAIAVGDGLVFLIDSTSKAQLDQMKRRGEEPVEKRVLVALDVDTGEVVWRTDESLAGRNSLSTARGVLLASSSKNLTAYATASGEVLWATNLGNRPMPVICGDTIYAEPYALELKTGAHLAHEHPLTGDPVDWSFRRAYGCGTISASPNLLMFRSGAFGFYDLAGDSGTHNFGGVRPGCYINLIAANGLVLAPNADSACTCAYNYQTSVALAPAGARNEDWSVFSVSTGAGTRIRQLRLNLGATGDRCDGDGKMWLGFPRPIYPRAVPVPMVTEYPVQLGYYRHNADDVDIQGTDRPWLYASGCTGLHRADLDLVVGRPVFAPPCEQAPKIDGVLDDACWDGRYPLPITDDKVNQDARISAFMRSDADNLYIGFDCKAALRDGKPVPWTANTTGEDASVWGDDAWQVFVTDAPRKLYLRLGVSASGARYDAKCTYARRDAIDKSWNGEWTSEVSASPDAWSLEMAIPRQMLADAGLDKNTVRINILGTNQTGVGPRNLQLTYPGQYGFGRCDYFRTVSLEEPPEAELRSYTVRLHFVEPAEVKSDERVFDVKLQGQVVLRGLDVAREAGASETALVKEFKGIEAGDTMKIELVSQGGNETATTSPVLSALEVYEE